MFATTHLHSTSGATNANAPLFPPTNHTTLRSFNTSPMDHHRRVNPILAKASPRENKNTAPDARLKFSTAPKQQTISKHPLLVSLQGAFNLGLLGIAGVAVLFGVLFFFHLINLRVYFVLTTFGGVAVGAALIGGKLGSDFFNRQYDEAMSAKIEEMQRDMEVGGGASKRKSIFASIVALLFPSNENRWR